MGIGDYLWPFERKFSQIPCAREASLAALLGGPAIGAVTYALTSKPNITYRNTIYSGFGLFWITFLVCRYEYERQKRHAQIFKEALATGKID